MAQKKKPAKMPTKSRAIRNKSSMLKGAKKMPKMPKYKGPDWKFKGPKGAYEREGDPAFVGPPAPKPTQRVSNKPGVSQRAPSMKEGPKSDRLKKIQDYIKKKGPKPKPKIGKPKRKLL